MTQTQIKKIKIAIVALAGTFTVSPTGASAQNEAASFTPQQIEAGSKTYARNCAPCHGVRMADPEGAFDLRKFTPDQRSRFVNSVTNGKNSMPPWGSLLSADDIGDLWAYVIAGEKR